MGAPRSDWLAPPNLLTLARLAATPGLIWLIVSGRRAAAAVLFGAMALSDNLDGRIARATGRVTQLGILLDPVCDRIVVMSAIATLMADRTLPVWLGAPVLGRDAVLSATFLALARRGFGRPAVNRAGKAATAGLLSGLPMLVWGGGLRPFGLGLFAAGGILYYAAAVLYARDVAAWARSRPPLGG